MKRLGVLLLVVGLLAALPLGNAALAKKGEKPQKVKICHVIAANDEIPFQIWGITGTLYFGKEITVAPEAVDAHLAHGDSLKYVPPETAAGPLQLFRDAGAKIPAANCYFFVRD